VIEKSANSSVKPLACLDPLCFCIDSIPIGSVQKI
jgi:hypothetical protein